MHLSRRGLLATGAGVAGVAVGGALVEYDHLPGRSRAHDLLGLNGGTGRIPSDEPGPRDEGSLTSRLVAQDPHYVISYPPGTRPGDALPVVVALHGAGRTAEAWFDELGVDSFLAASGHRMAVAAVDGGRNSFWHERSDGQDAGAMLREEFLPHLEQRGLDVTRMAVLGWSMGGLGALTTAARLAEAGHEAPPALAVSPALWPEYDQAMATAFDNRQQYDEAMTLVRASLAGSPRIDCGTGDPFYRDVRAVLGDYEGEQHYEAGAHEVAYWTRVLPGQLAWLAQGLSAG